MTTRHLDESATEQSIPFDDSSPREEPSPLPASSIVHLRVVRNDAERVSWPTVTAAVSSMITRADVDPELTVQVPVGELIDLLGKMQSQPAIEQAKGVVMGHYGLSSTTAFDVLKRWSQDGNVKLRILSQALLDEFNLHPSRDAAPHDLVRRVMRTAPGGRSGR